MLITGHHGDALTSRHPQIFSSQHITKIIATEAISLTVILYHISLLLCVYYTVCFDDVMNLNSFTRITISTHCPFNIDDLIKYIECPIEVAIIILLSDYFY